MWCDRVMYVSGYDVWCDESDVGMYVGVMCSVMRVM